jgi:hypothetical protein
MPYPKFRGGQRGRLLPTQQVLQTLAASRRSTWAHFAAELCLAGPFRRLQCANGRNRRDQPWPLRCPSHSAKQIWRRACVRGAGACMRAEYLPQSPGDGLLADCQTLMHPEGTRHCHSLIEPFPNRSACLWMRAGPVRRPSGGCLVLSPFSLN